MKVQSYILRSFVRLEFNLTEQELFAENNTEKRNVILNRIFAKFANHRLYRNGLKNLNSTDRFDSYNSFDHIKDFEMLSKDINITKQKSKDKLSRYKRKIHLARKDRFEARKRKRIRAIDSQEYKQKWEPKNKLTQSRLDRLEKLKESEKNNDYER